MEKNEKKASWSGSLTVNGAYLNIPVKKGRPKVKYYLYRGNDKCTEFDVELGSADDHDFIGFLSVRPYRGETLRVDAECEAMPGNPLAEFVFADAPQGLNGLYEERLRPKVHFTTRRGWINDPNGMVYHNGTYHLFYQHNPFGWNWGNMHWGHAVSKDMVHWTERDDALFPDPIGTMFSGSGAVDHGNTAGLQDGAEPTIALFYTAAGGCVNPQHPFTQCLAYSTDGGDNWRKLDKNPIVPHIAGGNRDPKVIWHKASKQWIMALYIQKRDDKQTYLLLGSPDLTSWTSLSEVCITGSGECPDFFELAVDGNPGDKRWVFWGADGTYLIGRFDGKNFTPESDILRFYGNNAQKRAHAYAAQTFSDIPDGRRIQMAWYQLNFEGMPFNHMMTLPIVLTLKTTPDGIRMCAEPAKEIESLHDSHRRLQGVRVGSDNVLPGRGELLHIRGSVRMSPDAVLSLNVPGGKMEIDRAAKELRCCGLVAALPSTDGALDIEIFVDRVSIEIFAAKGQLYLPVAFIPKEGAGCELTAPQGTVTADLDVFSLKTIWR